MPCLTVPQIEAAMTALAASAPPGVVTKVTFPNTTVSEGGIGPTTYSYLKIGKGGGTNRRTVLAVAGLHAREWAQPDAVVSFAKKLVDCYAARTDFVIPAYTAKGREHVRPGDNPGQQGHGDGRPDGHPARRCANPDGRRFSQSKKANHLWRKTRAPRPAGGTADEVGVDPNRNFDIAWDYDIYYEPSFAISADLMSSKFAADDTFIGKGRPVPNATHPDNEPETKNLVWLLDNNPVTWRIDNSERELEVALSGPLAAATPLTFDTCYFTEEDWDYGFVEVSDDNGATWQTVPVSSGGQVITTDTDPQGNNTEGNGLTGVSGGTYGTDSPEYVSATATLPAGITDVRFRYSTDAGYLDTGWFVSNVQVGGTSATVTPPEGEWTLIDGQEQDNNWSVQLISSCDITPASTWTTRSRRPRTCTSTGS